MAAAAGDRLSALPSNILVHILSFTPARQAAASAILSRRWRPLWHRTGTLNLDSRPCSAAAAADQRADSDFTDDDSSKADEAFFVRANAALDAFRPCRRNRRRRSWTGLKRLTVIFQRVHTYKGECRDEERVGRVVLAHPAAAGLEELRIDCNDVYIDKYQAPLASLPCAATLRVLELANCVLEPPAHHLDIPCLTDLRLRNCGVSEGYLQVMVDAAPVLTTLVLAYVAHMVPKVTQGSSSTRKYYYNWSYFRLRLRLRCPTVTALVLQTHGSKEDLEPSANSGIHLDMPSLRFFRYRGLPVKLSLVSPPPSGLALVDLHAARCDSVYLRKKDYEPVWRMLRSFSSTRVLKLRLQCIEDIIAGEEESEEQCLPTFPNLELLDLHGHYKYNTSKTEAAMARLLRSCPAMSELRLRLEMQWDYHHDRKFVNHVGGPFGQSLKRFNELAPMNAVQRGVVETCHISELASLINNDRILSCLRTTLRMVKLQFAPNKDPNSFQVRLAKFLVENAMVLEEMHVHDGSQFWPDHFNNKLARWRADSFRSRNLADTSGFHVYQLANSMLEDSKDQSGW